MAGLYRVIMGEDRAAAILRKAYGIRRRDCGRYRDTFLLRQAGKFKVCLLTRNGEAGFNGQDEYKRERECYTQHPLFLRQYSDVEDGSYITTEFSVGPEQKAIVHELEAKRWVNEKHKLDQLREKIDKLRSPDASDPEIRRLLDWGDKIFRPTIEKAMNEGVNMVTPDGEIEILVTPSTKTRVILDKEK